jgi:nucleoside-diphosphate-sugar epimerase
VTDVSRCSIHVRSTTIADQDQGTFEESQNSDQRYYVSDNSKFLSATGWEPRVGVEEGVGRLYDWLVQQGGASAVIGY